MPEVKRTSPDALKKIANRLAALDGYEIKAGWDKSAVYENGMPVAQIMFQNEFGNASRSIPARPFARPAIAEDKPKWDNALIAASSAYLKGKETPDSAFSKIGQMMENSLVDNIVRVTSPVLSPITILLRKWKKEGRKISGKVVGEAAAELAKNQKNGISSFTGSFANVSTKPLIDSGYAIATVSHVVGKETV